MDYQEILRTLSDEDFEFFINSPVWRCMKECLKERINITVDDLEAAPKEDTFVSLDNGKGVTMLSGVQKFQGALGELRYLIALPQGLKEDLNDLRKEDAENASGKENTRPQ